MIKCDCRIMPAHGEPGEIEFCAFHDAAEAMYEALDIILYERDNFLEADSPVWTLDPAFDIVSDAIDRADGK